MFCTMSGHFFLLSLITVIMQSYANIQTGHYTNLHEYDNLTTSVVENVLQTVFASANFTYENERYLADAVPDMTPPPNSVYDFIVVGAGTAGATVASRLTEIPDVQVLLIEAGYDENLFVDVPMGAPLLQSSNFINWKYQTEPSDKYCLGMQGHRCNWPRGKVMGGSSVLNFMVATRGSPKDYDRWAEMGNDGWAYKDVLKYFKKLENMQIPEFRMDKENHGAEGPVTINYPPYHTPLATAFLEAGQELGYPLVDYNGKNMIGFSYVQSTTSNGSRMSSNRAYLHSKTRKNLHVTKFSMVKKILINEETKTAVGVQLMKYSRQISVYARKEVILCAGAIGSPQLLMISGIGPGKHLRDLGIKVIKDSPVGDNLMDHIAYGGLAFETNQTDSLNVMDLFDISKPYVKDYMMERKGPLTIPGGTDAIAFINLDNPKDRNGVPSTELLFIVNPVFGSLIMMNNLGISNKIRQEVANAPRQGWSVFPMLLKPKSRGWIRLKSKDVNVKPMIVPNYLSHPEDIRILIAGIRETIKLSKTTPMKKFESKLFVGTFSECAMYEFDSDNYWLCCIRMITMNIYHYSGTCKMGRDNDTTAVVDPTLKVIGVKGLRIADASIIPEIPAAHTNIPVYMIAEKLADMVKQEWGYPTDDGK